MYPPHALKLPARLSLKFLAGFLNGGTLGPLFFPTSTPSSPPPPICPTWKFFGLFYFDVKTHGDSFPPLRLFWPTGLPSKKNPTQQTRHGRGADKNPIPLRFSNQDAPKCFVRGGSAKNRVIMNLWPWYPRREACPTCPSHIPQGSNLPGNRRSRSVPTHTPPPPPPAGWSEGHCHCHCQSLTPALVSVASTLG